MASENPNPRRPSTTRPGSETGAPAASRVRGAGRIKSRRRDANVYDAVAGRVTSTLPLQGSSDSRTTGFANPHHRPLDRLAATSIRRDPVLAPEDVLFRRAGAPPRFAEKDIYHAAERLQHNTPLPDADLLKTIHSYAAHFYEDLARRDADTQAGREGFGPESKPKVARAQAAKGHGGDDNDDDVDSAPEAGSGPARVPVIDELSMDETALLAFGIVLEEAAQEALGYNGDLVFTEGVIRHPDQTQGGEP